MVRVLFENGRNQIDALRVTPDRIAAAFARHPGILDRTEFAISDGPEAWAAEAPSAEVVFAGWHVDLTDWRTVAPRLRWLQSISAGVEHFLHTLPDHVLLTNASGVHAAKGGEFIAAAVLMLNYGIPRFADDKVHRRWRPIYGPPLAGKQVTLLGVGAIGAAAIRPLRTFGVRIVGVTRSGTPRPDLDRMVSAAAIDAVLPGTDFLVSSAPLSPETVGLIDRRRLGLLPTTAGVVVVGRSGVFDYRALQDQLTGGRLAGAVLDVFDTEPVPPDDPIWSCPNLIVTPHCSLDDHAGYLDACLAIFADNLRRYIDGKPLANLVDRRAGY